MSLGIASLGVSAVGTLLGAKAKRDTGKAQNAAAERNARLEEMTARQEDLEARTQIRRHRQAAKRFTGNQVARYAASGIVTSTGSALEVMGRDAGRMELEALEQARVAGSRVALRHARAGEIRFAGRQAKKAGSRAAFGSLLSGTAGAFTQRSMLIDQGAL